MSAQQSTQEQLAQWWETGSLWQVGSNVERVAEARKNLIAAGDEGLKFTLTKLDVSDTLQLRCLRAVIRGYGDKAIAPLSKRIADKDDNVRRNTAELLGRLKATSTQDALLKQAKIESNEGVRLAQLTTLSGWQTDGCVEILTLAASSKNQRVRQRISGLLAKFDSEESGKALVAMLDDDVHFVRHAASKSLQTAGPITQKVASDSFTQFLTDDPRNVSKIRSLMFSATNDQLLILAEDTDTGIRADVARQLGERGMVAELKELWKDEDDPFVMSTIENAIETAKKKADGD